MMDLSIVYSKTAKGLRARTSLIGGLPSQLMKALSHVDGTSKAEDILAKFGKITEQELVHALTQLEEEGYIRTVKSSMLDDGWSPTAHFAPMVVEEFSTEEAAVTEAEKIKLLAADEALMAAQTAQMQADIKAREKVERVQEKLKLKEKSKAETKVKAKISEELAVVRLTAEKLALEKLAEEKKVEEKQAAEKLQQKKRVEQALIDQTIRQQKLIEKKQAEQALIEQKKAALAARLATELAAEMVENEKLALVEQARNDLSNAIRQAEVQRKQAEEIAKQARQTAKQQATAQEEAQINAQRARREADKKQKAAEKVAEKERLSTKIKDQQLAAKQLQESAEADKKAENENEKAKAKAKAELETLAIALAKIENEKLEANKELSCDLLIKEEKLKQENIIRVEKSSAKQIVNEHALIKQTLNDAQQEEIDTAERIKAHADAEDKAMLAAKENARLEMQRIAQEADLAIRQQQDAASNKPNTKYQFTKLGDWEEIEAIDEASFLADERTEQAKKQAADSKKANQEIEKLSREDIKKLAAEVARAMEEIKSKRKLKSYYFKKWFAGAKKVSFIYVPILLLLVLGGLPFVNVSMLIKPIEQRATQNFGQPVRIGQVHISLWPQPHLSLSEVHIDEDLTIDEVNAVPALLTLNAPVITLKALEINGLSISQHQFAQPLKWLQHSSNLQSMAINEIEFKNIVLHIKDFALEPMMGKVTIDKAQAVQNIAFNNADKTFNLLLTPLESNYSVAITGKKWVMPINPKIVFDEIVANGNYRNNSLNFNQIEGEIFGGRINGEASIDWENDWKFASKIGLNNANINQLLAVFNSNASIDGKLKLNAQFTGGAISLEKLNQSLNSTVNFSVNNGKINHIDLTQAVMLQGNQSLAGDATLFSSITGYLQFIDGRYLFKQLTLKSNKFVANGNLNIAPDAQIAGNIYADLTTQAQHMHAKFALAGSTTNVKWQ